MANRQIAQLDSVTPTINFLIPIQDGDGDFEAKRASIEAVGLVLNPFTIYRALLSQSSTGAPTANVLQTSLGTLTFSRSGVGVYLIESGAAFTTNKTFASPQYSTVRVGANYTSVLIELDDASNISLKTYLQGIVSDDVLIDFPIEIIVYP